MQIPVLAASGILSFTSGPPQSRHARALSFFWLCSAVKHLSSTLDFDIFVAIVNAGSMSGAGRALGYSPAVISKCIQRLEKRLKITLFHRTTRQLQLTESGSVFYERVL